MVITVSQKVMLREFGDDFFKLLDKYWTPESSDAYWDSLTSDAMELLGRFQSDDVAINNLLSNIVAAFLNSREELAA